MNFIVRDDFTAQSEYNSIYVWTFLNCFLLESALSLRMRTARSAPNRYFRELNSSWTINRTIKRAEPRSGD